MSDNPDTLPVKKM